MVGFLKRHSSKLRKNFFAFSYANYLSKIPSQAQKAVVAFRALDLPGEVTEERPPSPPPRKYKGGARPKTTRKLTKPSSAPPPPPRDVSSAPERERQRPRSTNPFEEDYDESLNPFA